MIEARGLAKQALADKKITGEIEEALNAQFDERFKRIFNS